MHTQSYKFVKFNPIKTNGLDNSETVKPNIDKQYNLLLLAKQSLLVEQDGLEPSETKGFQFLCEADTEFERISLYVHEKVILRQATFNLILVEPVYLDPRCTHRPEQLRVEQEGQVMYEALFHSVYIFYSYTKI
ncbi:hypothetical protein E2C01_023073 [Portunus trituberculatus]|uniref:Uncharacterized protein n=1 Tax=Portunus trituberculatus TaxID=210409 RepID=A0A5B7EA77_PORTR|nr:hypothetical protein [Portunus trituberculatus]